MNLNKLQENLKNYKPSFSPELQKIAADELNENPETRGAACIELYSSFYNKIANKSENSISSSLDLDYWDKQLTSPRFLLRFLRVAKFDQNVALAKMTAWIKTISGIEWPELGVRLKDRTRLKAWVKNYDMFLLNRAITSDSNSNSGFSNERPWMVLNHDNKIGKDIKEYFLDVAALSLISVDYIFKTDEAATVLGMYNANIIDKDQKSSGGWAILANPGLFKKMIKLWTKTLAIRSRGSIKLNYQKSALMAAFEMLVKPFLSQKMSSRRKNFGEDWLENNGGLFEVGGIPKKCGGGLDDELGLKWIDEYFDRGMDQ